MPIQAVNNLNISNIEKKLTNNSVSITGYGALGFGTASAIAGYQKKIKLHKHFAYIAGALAFLHTGIIEYYHHKRRNGKKS